MPETKTISKSRTKSSTIAHGVGRRKSAVARVWLKRGKGALSVNGKEHGAYFDTTISKKTAYVPFEIYEHAKKYDAQANVQGGGMRAQADAIKLGIARAFLAIDETLKPLLRKNELLTVDARVKERKKYGQRGARRKFQFVKR